MSTLATCLKNAAEHWRGTLGNATSAEIQVFKIKVCVEILGPARSANKLTSKDASKLLQGLLKRGLARKTIQDYYSTFKRMLALNDTRPEGISRWPKAAKPPRKSRLPISAGNLTRMVATLNERNFGETGDLATLLNAIGGRVQREVLWTGNLKYRHSDGTLLVHITGKGGSEREIPIACKNARAIITDRKRYRAVLAVPYKTHLWRWNAISSELGIKGLATFHNIRHKYATERLVKSRGNLRLVQELLGHGNPATTAIYAHVGLDEMIKALQE